jgi:hypothetical protein
MLMFASEEPNLQACEEISEEENDDVVYHVDGFLSTDDEELQKKTLRYPNSCQKYMFKEREAGH